MNKSDHDQLRADAGFLIYISQLLSGGDWQLPRTGRHVAEVAKRIDAALDEIAPTIYTSGCYQVEDNGDE